MATGLGGRGLGRIDARSGMDNGADGTAAIMRAGLAGLISLAGGRSPIVVTDRSRMEGIGGSSACGPACADRCQNLHHQGDQDDRKKLPQPPTHEKTHPSTLLTKPSRLAGVETGVPGISAGGAQPVVVKSQSFPKPPEF
jgi:hypothetical protein